MLHINCLDVYEQADVIDLVRYLYIFYGYLKKNGDLKKMPPCLQGESIICEKKSVRKDGCLNFVILILFWKDYVCRTLSLSHQQHIIIICITTFYVV